MQRNVLSGCKVRPFNMYVLDYVERDVYVPVANLSHIATSTYM